MLGAILVAAIPFGAAGCVLPLLSMIPSAISLAHAAYTAGSGSKDDAEAKNQEAETPTEEASATTPPPQLTPANLCKMMSLTHPDVVLVELRKNSAGDPEYRDLHLQSSAEEAHWTPTVDSETGPDGWIPAVNFLKMNFQPPLANSIPDVGTSYLAYAPIAIDPNNPYQAAELKSETGNGMDTFFWQGRVYEYTVARTPPCLSPSS